MVATDNSFPRRSWIGGLLLAVLGWAGTAAAFYPHGSANDIGCESCHVPWTGVGLYWLPPSVIHTPVDADDTPFNSLCWSCHNDVIAPRVETHSSLSTDAGYGDWSVECRDCHWPHLDPQYRAYGADSTLDQRTVAAVGPNSVTVQATPWAADEHAGRLLIPNTEYPLYTYKILGNTADTLQVDGFVDPDHAAPGGTLAIVYGRSIRAMIETPSSGRREVRLFRADGPNSFADGDGIYDGICEACHTQTAFHRNNGAGDHSHGTGEACTACHLHSNGFGVGGSHSVHGSEIQGPSVVCAAGDRGCHGAETPPPLADGQILEHTGTCTNCHSLDGTSGAKAYWANSGSSVPVPEPGSWAATEGDESFCGRCHDGTPGNTAADGSGRTAPNVMGDASIYGFGVTGHGKSSGHYARMASQADTETGNPAANRKCRDCHDPQSQHFGAADQRLRAGYENDQSNSNCNNCHEPGGVATADPQLYVSSADFEATLHGPLLCTQCHDVHGMAGSYVGMARDTSRALCLACHTSVRVPSAPPAAHDAGATDPCATCHNPHNPAHGQGSGGGCIECHGHDAGTAYDPDATGPYTAGSQTSLGAGTSQSHSTHTETDADDLKGPGLYCDDCHDTANFPYFASGEDGNGDGHYDLSETDVCDACHSPGGSYDGVDDLELGAKNIWSTGAYLASDDSTLAAGREKWCATCHDEVPSVIRAVSAPNVVGGESEAYTYGTGWGYYETGHGLGSAVAYPSSGGVALGAGLECAACHDYATAHVDGQPRTYAAQSPAVYRSGYRLNQVELGGGPVDPMTLPWPQNTPLAPERFALCASCHNPGPFQGLNDNTNMVYGGTNYHAYHIGITNIRFDSDWSGAPESRIICTTCHNVHGSTQLSMVRDGTLIGREPGLQVWYKNDAVVSYNPTNADPPEPEDLTLIASTGIIWNEASSANVCSTCHTHNWTTGHDRSSLWWPTSGPVLDWTWEPYYQGRGIHTDRLFNATESVPFRFTYYHPAEVAPAAIELWVDLDDSGSYEGGEMMALVEDDPGDTTYSDGKIYRASVTLTNPGDNAIVYRVYASDGSVDAVGQPTQEQTIEWDASLTRDVPGEYVTLQGAIDAAYDGNTIVVADGVYNEGIDYGGKDLVIRSENGAAVTAITGSGGLEPCVRFSNGETAAVLEGFTLDNANTSPSGDGPRGVLIENGATPTIRDCVITGNTTNVNASGGGIKISGGSMTLEGTSVTNNSACYGGGIYAENVTEPMTITNCTIDDNTGLNNAGVSLVSCTATTTFTSTSISGNNSGAQGGGISASDSAIELYNCTLNDNVGGNASGEHGGALYLVGAATSAVIESSTLNGNTSARGAGIYMSGSTEAIPLTVTGSDISNNTGNNGYGGGLYLENCANPSYVTDTTITGNTTYGAGGGVWTNSSLTITGCDITGNLTTHTPEDGGGIYGTGASTILTLTDTTITGNTSNQGGGVAAYVQELHVTGGSISGNTASGQYSGGGLRGSGAITVDGVYIQGNSCGHSGAGIYCTGATSSLTVTNSMITGNRGGTYTFARGGGIRSDTTTTSVMNSTVTANFATDHGGISVVGGTVTNSIVWNNFISGGRTVLNVSGATVSFSDTSGSGYTDGGDNIDADPLFLVPSSAYPSTAGDFRLQATSPCKDQGTSVGAPAVDIGGDSRPYDAGYDMGADEYDPAGFE